MVLRLRLGGERQLKSSEESKTLTFHKDEGSFQAVVSFLISMMGFASLVDIYGAYNAGSGKPWSEEDHAVFDGLTSNVRLQWRPNYLVSSVVRNYQPEQITFECFELEPLPKGETVNLGSLDTFIIGLSQMMLVSYFEDRKDLIKQNFKVIKNWPEVWQFARIVRNALSHGNKINIHDGYSATWNGLTYSEVQNGQTVINADLFPGDLIVLLRELEDSLPGQAI